MKYLLLPGGSNFLKGIIYLNLENTVLQKITPAKQPWNLLAEVIYSKKKIGIWIAYFHIVWPQVWT